MKSWFKNCKIMKIMQRTYSCMGTYVYYKDWLKYYDTGERNVIKK